MIRKAQPRTLPMGQRARSCLWFNQGSNQPGDFTGRGDRPGLGEPEHGLERSGQRNRIHFPMMNISPT